MITFSQKRNPYSHWEYFNQESGDRLRVVPERGGLVTEWLSNGVDVLYFDEERFLQEDKSVRGGIPVLFPICGDLVGNNSQPLDGGRYPLNQHGFARDCQWGIRLLEDQLGIHLTLVDCHLTRSYFPYSFLLELEVRLQKGTMNIHATIINHDEKPMPFTLGLHPYFNISSLTKVHIQGLNSQCVNQVNMHTEDTDKLISNLSQGVDFMTSGNKKVQIIDLVSHHSVELAQSYPMDITVVWTDPPRSMICVEPWTSPRNSLISGDRRLLVNPGEKYKLETSISLKS